MATFSYTPREWGPPIGTALPPRAGMYGAEGVGSWLSPYNGGVNRRLRPLVIAHAGCAGHGPENTLLSIACALSMGVDAVEVDVRFTADGVPVLMHDETVDRTTDGHGPLAFLTWAQVRSLRIAGGERVPSLEEAARALKGHALLVAEVKVPGGEEAVARAIAATVGEEGAQVWSFHPRALLGMMQAAPRVPRVLLLDAQKAATWPRPLAVALGLGADGIAVQHEALGQRHVAEAHRYGLRVYAWTVDAPQDLERVLALGVDGIVSNYPEHAMALLGPSVGREGS